MIRVLTGVYFSGAGCNLFWLLLLLLLLLRM